MILELKNLRLPLSSFELRINVTVSGAVVALFGPSGSGKTTLLNLLAGLKKPTEGSIVLDGTVLTDQKQGIFVPPAKRGIGYVPQEGLLFPHLRVKNNLIYGMKPDLGKKSVSFPHVCEVLGLNPLLGAYPNTLSGGEKQRVALGRALLSAPRILLLDEPFASLDEELKNKGIALLKRIHEEFRLPILYVSHSTQEIDSLCDKALFLERGVITREVRLPDLFFSQQTTTTTQYPPP